LRVAVFGFECVDLGKIKKIEIHHDNTGIDPGWFLDKVVIESTRTIACVVCNQRKIGPTMVLWNFKFTYGFIHNFGDNRRQKRY